MKNILPTPTPLSNSLQENYKLPITGFEWQFLKWSHWFLMAHPGHARARPLEICVFHEFHRKRILKIVQLTGKTKVKATAAEILALKRLLRNTQFPTDWAPEAQSLLFTIDQLTVGIQ
jgi:hypothetical protein